ncbi:MAG: DUF1217 domain-containing protein [Proteobacteria bacterium]|nr:DUF1217 domain-containing protein [Pseudomonadota bacterium]
MTASIPSVGMPIVDYQLATANQAQLMAQFQKSSTTRADIAAYQTGVAKITTVDQFLNNYKVLKVALTAYGMQDMISQKGLLKQLLTQDPTSSTSVAQRLGKQNWIAFAQAYSPLTTDGGATLQSPDSVNAAIARYTSAAFQQWIGVRDNDSTLTTALAAKQTLQDAVNISDVGALYAQYQSLPDVQSAVSYYQRNVGNVKSVADLMGDPKLLDFALTAYGIDPASVSTDTVQKLLTESISQPTSAAANNPAYQAFANAFSQLRSPGGSGAISTAQAVKDVTDRYQQRTFSQIIATNTDAQNVSMFGAAGAKKITQILGDAKTEAGLGLATSYYASHVANARTAAQFAADNQLVAVAEGAYGFSHIPADALSQLLTQDPTASDSLAQISPQYAAFAKAFSFYGPTGGSSQTAAAAIAAIQTAYMSNKMQTTLQTDIGLAAAQATRNTNIRENASAPLNLYQLLGDSNISTVILGAYNQPAMVGAFAPDQQVETITHAGFKAASLNSPMAIDSLIKRYMANVGAQSAPTSPLLTLFGTAPDPGQITALDLSSIFGGGASASSAALANSPTGYLLNLL